MKDKVKLALKELRFTLSTIQIFNAIIDTLVVFAIVQLMITLIGSLEWHYALYIAIPFFIFHSIALLRKVSYKAVEEKVPALREALRTSADYLDRENQVVMELHQEVLRKMKQIKTSYFLGIGRSFKRLVLLTAICYAVILVAVFNFHLSDMRETTDKLIRFEPLKDYAGQLEELIIGDDSEIYGEPTKVTLGTEELNLEITPIMSELDIKELKPLEDKEFEEQFPDEVYASAESAYEEDLAEEHKELVKNYFSRLAGE